MYIYITCAHVYTCVSLSVHFSRRLTRTEGNRAHPIQPVSQRMVAMTNMGWNSSSSRTTLPPDPPPVMVPLQGRTMGRPPRREEWGGGGGLSIGYDFSCCNIHKRMG